MNVLVYNGPEIVPTSLRNCLTALRSILTSYSVQTLTKQTLLSEPWSPSCSLLVIPECQRPPTFSKMDSLVSFVNGGGSILCVSSGVRYTPLLQHGVLGFLEPKTGSIFEVVSTGESGEGQQLATVLPENESPIPVARNPNKTIPPPPSTGSSHVLHRFSSGDIASLVYQSGEQGKVVFSAVAMEMPLGEVMSEGTTTTTTDPYPLLVDTLRYLGLNTSKASQPAANYLGPLPQLLVVSPFTQSGILERVLAAVDPHSSGWIKDEHDTFRLVRQEQGGLDMLAQAKTNQGNPVDTKDIIVCDEGYVPGATQVPLFDLKRYFDALSQFRRIKDPSTPWGMGDVLLYGEAVTSTQTMLDKNPTLHTSIPTPLVSLASHQLAGRGRGANVWLSPSGCLQFSVLLRLSLSTFPANKLVFVQYLFALAVVEACSTEAVLGPEVGKRVRIKWPNDIYATLDNGEVKKIGGILVNSSFSSGQVDVVIGSGLNVLNEAPIMSLSQLEPTHRRRVGMEETAASILTRFEMLWESFVAQRGSFESFMNPYLERWLHSDQLVTVTTMNPPQLVRIVGITPDHGLLRTIPEREGGRGGFVDLQPDGNSFDLLSGMIRLKS